MCPKSMRSRARGSARWPKPKGETPPALASSRLREWSAVSAWGDARYRRGSPGAAGRSQRRLVAPGGFTSGVDEAIRRASREEYIVVLVSRSALDRLVTGSDSILDWLEDLLSHPV
jgi:hypothetical protein